MEPEESDPMVGIGRIDFWGPITLVEIKFFGFGIGPESPIVPGLKCY